MANVNKSLCSLHIYYQLSWGMETQFSFFKLLNMNLVFFNFSEAKGRLLQTITKTLQKIKQIALDLCHTIYDM